jgi:hypothetical protein
MYLNYIFFILIFTIQKVNNQKIEMINKMMKEMGAKEVNPFNKI